MKKFALIGESISHSLSPVLFNNTYSGTRGYSYDLIDASDLSKAIMFFDKYRYSGANITAPFKEDIIGLCSQTDEAAATIGASNLIVRKNNELYAFNTDHNGVSGPLDARSITPDSGKAIVAGAGGAARAAVYALKKMGFAVTIINRSWEKALKLAEEFGVEAIPAQDSKEAIKRHSLLIYTASSLIPQMNTPDLSNLTILEANYKNPSLQNIKSKEYISGKEWLIYQAIPSFYLMTGIRPAPDSLFKIIDNY